MFRLSLCDFRGKEVIPGVAGPAVARVSGRRGIALAGVVVEKMTALAGFGGWGVVGYPDSEEPPFPPRGHM